MIGLDTNALLRIFINDNDKQSLAMKGALESAKCSFYINMVVLCETIWTLRKTYKHSKEHIIQIIHHLIENDDFYLEDESVIEDALEIYKNTTVEFADILISLRNLSAGCKYTMTFDAKAAKIKGFKKLA